MLIRGLPARSGLVAALNDGKPGWTTTDHLLADVWTLLAQVHGDPDKAPKDHPARAQLTAKATAVAKQASRAAYLERKRRRKPR